LLVRIPELTGPAPAHFIKPYTPIRGGSVARTLDLEGTNFANCVLSQPEVVFSFPRVIPYVG